MSGHDEACDAVRAGVLRAFGPDVVHDALETEEARSYIAARREADAELAAFAAAKREQAHEIATMINAGVIRLPGGVELPEGMCFTGVNGPVFSMSEKDIERAREEFRRALASHRPPVWLRPVYGRGGNLVRMKRLRPGVLPLPRRVRLRLTTRRVADSIGIRLAARHPEAARRWWQAFGMWPQ